MRDLARARRAATRAQTSSARLPMSRTRVRLTEDELIGRAWLLTLNAGTRRESTRGNGWWAAVRPSSRTRGPASGASALRARSKNGCASTSVTCSTSGVTRGRRHLRRPACRRARNWGCCSVPRTAIPPYSIPRALDAVALRISHVSLGRRHTICPARHFARRTGSCVRDHLRRCATRIGAEDGRRPKYILRRAAWKCAYAR